MILYQTNALWLPYISNCSNSKRQDRVNQTLYVDSPLQTVHIFQLVHCFQYNVPTPEKHNNKRCQGIV